MDLETVDGTIEADEIEKNLPVRKRPLFVPFSATTASASTGSTAP